MYGKRVHIVPVGDDVDRMIGPAVEMRADVVYLLAHAPGAMDGAGTEGPLCTVEQTQTREADRRVQRLERHGFETAAEAVERLAVNDITARVEFVDQHDVYAVLGLATTLASRRPADDDVAVNVSTGTRLATVGAALARMDEDTDAEAYHVPAGDSETGSGNRDQVADIPDYHLESPSRSELAAMAIVAARDTAIYTPKKSDLIDWGLRLRGEASVPIGYSDRIARSALERGTDADAPEQFDELDSSGKKGAYRTLRTQVLDGLLERGYVDVADDQVGRADRITLTPTGEAALRAFRHKVSDVVEALEDHAAIEDLPPWLRRGLLDDGEQ